VRKAEASYIQKLINKQGTIEEKCNMTHTKRQYNQWNTKKKLKQKVYKDQRIITKDDKGNTLVIL
jgi:hypothetical protein